MDIICQCLVHKYYLWNVSIPVVPCSDKREIVGFEMQTLPHVFLAGSTGQNVTVHKVPRSPLSGIPVRTAPAAAVSPMQVQGTLSILVVLKWVNAVFATA